MLLWMLCEQTISSGNNDPNDRSTATIKYHFPPALELEYGVPEELCHETAAGSEVFTRKWTNATVTLDCKNWVGTIVSG